MEPSGLSAEERRALIEAFAHELAEWQHDNAREYEATQTEDFVAGMQVAADLIDPAKESDRG
jgi:TRAP-type C4-dicarboxylate transport system substrate-binding protein